MLTDGHTDIHTLVWLEWPLPLLSLIKKEWFHLMTLFLVFNFITFWHVLKLLADYDCGLICSLVPIANNVISFLQQNLGHQGLLIYFHLKHVRPIWDTKRYPCKMQVSIHAKKLSDIMISIHFHVPKSWVATKMLNHLVLCNFVKYLPLLYKLTQSKYYLIQKWSNYAVVHLAIWLGALENYCTILKAHLQLIL